MSRPNRLDQQDYENILQKSGLSVLRRSKWCNVNFDKKFQADFTILGEKILVSRPSGYAGLKIAQQAFHLECEAIRQCIPENAPYVIIEDYSYLSGVSHDARKFFIHNLRNRQNLLAIIFCNTTALFNLSIKLAKKIYPLKTNILIAGNLSEAILQAKNMLSQNDNSPGEKKVCKNVTCRKEWALNLRDYKMRFELINGNIMHPVPTGFLTAEHIEPIFKLQEKVFAEMNLTDGEYYLLADLKVLEGATLKARRLFEKAVKKWHRKHPTPMLIFYNANWMLRAAINIARVVATYNVRIANDFDSAIKLISENNLRRLGKNPADALDTQNNPKDRNQKYVDEIISILAGINWERQDIEVLSRKIKPSHPFRPVAEAVSLIKMDMDQVLSDHKKVEKKLFESREKYKNILNSIEEGYYETDLAGNLTFFNDSLCKILGYTKDELQGINYRKISDKKYLQVIYETFNQVYKTGISAKDLKWKLVRKDGTTRFVEISVSCIYDEKDTPLGFRGIVRDITQRINAEKEKEQLEARLRHAQKMEAIGTLAGGVAHDLNNILSGLVSYPDLLLMKLPPESPLRNPIQTIQRSGEKAAAIVQDLLTLARKGLPDRNVSNLNALILEYLKSPEHGALLTHHPAINIVSDFDDKLLNMFVSSVHISKIVMNLIINAVEAMPDGGTINIATRNLYLDSPLPGYRRIKEGEYIKLQVSDNGIGMSSEDKERIFEPFYTRKSMGRSGTGLGMAMVWGAVHDHNGYIDVSSNPGKGATISIYLPAVRTDIPAGNAHIPAEIFSGKNEKILIVDDISEQRELAARMLTELGYIAKSVASGEEAVEYIKSSHADLLLIDMIMDPGIDGLDTYKKIIAVNPGQKAVIVTGFSTSERIIQAQALGAGGCLKKPYLIESLAQIVREELAR